MSSQGGPPSEQTGLLRGRAPTHEDATQTEQGASLSWEERFTSQQGRTILAFGLSVISVLFVLFIVLSAKPHGHGKEESGPAGHAPSGGTPPKPIKATPPAVKDNAPVGSPTDPRPRISVPGCPVVAAPPPGRRYIQVGLCGACRILFILILPHTHTHTHITDQEQLQGVCVARHHSGGCRRGRQLVVEGGRVQDLDRRVVLALP